jgi:alpha-galactosidase
MKIVLIGAGSMFGRNLSMEIMSREVLKRATIALCDIDRKKLKLIEGYLRKIVEHHDLPTKIVASPDRREVLEGADFVVISVAIGGPAYYGPTYENEMRIPLKYGIRQTIGDTVGPGGIFRALRTAPEMLGMVEDINRLAPRSIILNYTNPMAILSWLLIERAQVPAVGLCHSVQETAARIARHMGVAYEEVSYWVAGINHMAWFLELTYRRRNAYPRLRRAAKKRGVYKRDSVRFDIMENFGYFPTESSRHNSEYVPYYQHEQDRLEAFEGFVRRVRKRRTAELRGIAAKVARDEKVELVRSNEYAPYIMEAITTGVPYRFNGNVLNHGLITNLPAGCCVEVPTMIDGEGVHPCYVGDLPPQCAAQNRTNINVHELTVDAVRHRSREAAHQALLLDPVTRAVLPLKKIRRMFEELWKKQRRLLKYYR